LRFEAGHGGSGARRQPVFGNHARGHFKSRVAEAGSRGTGPSLRVRLARQCAARARAVWQRGIGNSQSLSLRLVKPGYLDARGGRCLNRVCACAGITARPAARRHAQPRGSGNASSPARGRDRVTHHRAILQHPKRAIQALASSADARHAVSVGGCSRSWSSGLGRPRFHATSSLFRRSHLQQPPALSWFCSGR
jgi:hypothetical protein